MRKPQAKQPDINEGKLLTKWEFSCGQWKRTFRAFEAVAMLSAALFMLFYLSRLTTLRTFRSSIKPFRWNAFFSVIREILPNTGIKTKSSSQQEQKRFVLLCLNNPTGGVMFLSSFIHKTWLKFIYLSWIKKFKTSLINTFVSSSLEFFPPQSLTAIAAQECQQFSGSLFQYPLCTDLSFP